eukprot:4830608-Pyramimonas_sp.AAC.1
METEDHPETSNQDAQGTGKQEKVEQASRTSHSELADAQSSRTPSRPPSHGQQKERDESQEPELTDLTQDEGWSALTRDSLPDPFIKDDSDLR